MTSRVEIARHYLDYLREHPDACGWISIRAGRHPYLRYDTDREGWLLVENAGFGEVEAEVYDDAERLLPMLASNPVDLLPAGEATSHGPAETVWDQLDSGEKATVID